MTDISRQWLAAPVLLLSLALFPAVSPAQAENSGWTTTSHFNSWVTGSVELSVKYQSNATLGSKSSQFVLDDGSLIFINQSFKDNDFAVDLDASMEHRLGVERPGVPEIVTSAVLSATRQINLRELDSIEITASTGPEFAMTSAEFLQWVRPYAEGQWEHTNDVTLLFSYGGGIDFGGLFMGDEGKSWSVDADLLYFDFMSSSIFPFVDERDGPNMHVESNLAWPLGEQDQIFFTSVFERQWARVGYESYYEAGGTVQLSHVFADPLGGQDFWNASLSSNISHRRYDTPDPFIDPFQRRADFDMTLSAQLAIPIKGAISANLRVSRRWIRSTVRNFVANDTSVTAGMSYQF